jgi:hypothetical protein
MKTSSITRRSRVTPAERFALLVELFYNMQASIGLLADRCGYSQITTKRIVWHFKNNDIIKGRIGSSTLLLDLSGLCKLNHLCALVFIEIDIPTLKQQVGRRETCGYDTEEGLFAWISKGVALNREFKGKAIVEDGFIAIGEKDYRMIIRAYTLDSGTLFQFCQELKKIDCITQARVSPIYVVK